MLLRFVIWACAFAGKGVLPRPVEIAGVLAMLAAAWVIGDWRQGWGFAAATVAVALTILSIFSELYPRVMVSSSNPAYSLTIYNTASAAYSLKVMTHCGRHLPACGPRYTAWTYYVFRRRLSVKDFQASPDH